MIEDEKISLGFDIERFDEASAVSTWGENGVSDRSISLLLVLDSPPLTPTFQEKPYVWPDNFFKTEAPTGADRDRPNL